MTVRKRILQAWSASRDGSQQAPSNTQREIDKSRARTCLLRAGTARAPMIITAGLALMVGFVQSGFAASNAPHPYGLISHKPSQPYLSMPHESAGKMPKLLSQTGAFRSTRAFESADNLVAYDLAVPFWSDGAGKIRWVSLPKEKIEFAAQGEWKFPSGTVFIKTFELPIDQAKPDVKRRLETRLLVRDSSDGVYGVSYKWRGNNEDADLLETNLTEAILIHTPTGIRTQIWYYPSRSDCLTCHTKLNGGVLGPKTRQLNCEFRYPSDIKDNQLRTWNHLDLFDTQLDETELSKLPSLAGANNKSRTIEDRARSYLDANCAHCHRPGGTVAYFDARYDTPLAEQNLINGQVLIDQRIDNPRVVAPNDVWRSILYMRANTIEPFKMPPLAHNAIDESGMEILRQWIESLPGPPVLRPPKISPHGGNFDQTPEVTITTEAGAEIHYTLDGTVPTKADPLYREPIQLREPTIVRARAFRTGFVKSIVTQQIYTLNR